MTAEAFFDWANRPENRDKRFELLKGEVAEMPSPSERHCLVCGNVGYVLNGYVRRRGQGYVLTNDPGIILERDPDTVRGPDVVLFLVNRRYGELNPKFAEGIPTLAVEVLSPSDRIGKVTRRIAQFLKSGIRLAWLIDPEARDVTVYRPNQDDYVVDDTQELTGDGVLPEFSCRGADFFFMLGDKPEGAAPTA
jgi:Uma2 family endonuclease